MEAKKSTEANIERLRIPITLLGILFTGSIVLASFSFTSSILRDSKIKSTENIAEINFLEEVERPDQPEPIPQQTVVLPPDQNIIIDSNTQIIPDPIVIILDPPIIDLGKKIVIVDPPIIDFPDVEASFKDGAVAMQQWIVNNVQYPQTAIEMNEQGRVYLSFVVEIDGSITNVAIERGVSSELDKEAKRLLRKMPKWVAGEAAGKKVRTRCRLPINFTLN